MPITANTGLVLASIGVPVTLTTSHLLVQSFSNNQPSNAQLLITVTAPPAHGVLALSGSSATQFTNADLLNGLITYTSTDGLDDSFSIFTRATTTPDVPKPYTPHFTLASSTMPTTQGAIYLSAALVGSSACPASHGTVGATSGSGAVTNTMTWDLDLTNQANNVIVFGVGSEAVPGSGLSGPVALTSVSVPGLTLTHIGHGSMTTSTSVYASIWTTIDWYWAAVPAAMTTTLTATYAASFVQAYMNLVWHSFTGIASLSAPFDTNASNLQSLTTSTLPATMTLMADAPDNLVLPVFFEIVSGDNLPSGPDLLMTMGYDAYGYFYGYNTNWEAQVRSSATATVPIHGTSVIVTPPPTTLLAMDDVVCTTEAAGTENLIFLAWSDDRGHSFGNPVGQSMGAEGEYSANLQWRRLGYARDRIFSLEWSVPAPTALQGAWISVGPADS